MRPPRTVLWDLDGTLTDSVDLIVETTNLVITRNGGQAAAFETIGAMMGMSLETVFRQAWPGLPAERYAQLRDEYRAHYDEHVIPATRLFRGAKSTLQALRRAGIRQAMVTGKRATDGERILRGLGVGSAFGLFLGGDSVARPKPDPDLVLLALEHLGLRPDEAVVVGDARNDMRMGRSAGARTIQVLWGCERRPVPEADAVARTWIELRALLLANPAETRNGSERRTRTLLAPRPRR